MREGTFAPRSLARERQDARLQPLYSPAVIRELLERHGLRPNKALGQNFLADRNILGRIVAASEIAPGDVVLEIGAGLGSLTQALLEAGARVIAIEKDNGLAKALAELFSSCDNAIIVHGDALRLDWAELVHAHGPLLLQDTATALPRTIPCKVVANLPYYITSPLLMHLLEGDLDWERAVVMVQREVAQRLVAAPGTKEYGALTVGVQYRARIERLGPVPPTVFVPPPAVASEIVRLKPKPELPVVGKSFPSLVKAAFGQRRKTLRNALRQLSLAPAQIEEALTRAGISAERRGETLSVEEFVILSKAIDELVV